MSPDTPASTGGDEPSCPNCNAGFPLDAFGFHSKGAFLVQCRKLRADERPVSSAANGRAVRICDTLRDAANIWEARGARKQAALLRADADWIEGMDASRLESSPPPEPSDVFGMDTPWPLPDVLGKLIHATEHLLGAHGCDAHGHEEYRAAADAGRRLHALMMQRPPRETGECPQCRGTGGFHLTICDNFDPSPPEKTRENPHCLNDGKPCAPADDGTCVACSDFAPNAVESHE